MSRERLISSINKSKPVNQKNLNNVRIEKIKKDFYKFRDRPCKAKIKQIRKDIYRIENKKIKGTEKSLLRLEKSLSRLKKYHHYDDIEYRGIRDVKHLFDLSIYEDYYKSIKTNDAFNSNFIEYESKGDKNNLNMIKPYLIDIINDHKTQGEWKVYSGNEVINYKTQGEWKVQLAMIINFISSKDSDEIRTMHTKNNDIVISKSNNKL